ncbi:hypothetical protein [Yinghuangia soli]|uniref:Uncharacterized protein n=1 Tax=Yinghuangia soli TaxID=2908204 RepID=A0AA41Q788_9ACTN|nr:hypothetical protein [Yinghuangia soli]MCF2532496.1 hypothetical protein [Yinghuangia soli]
MFGTPADAAGANTGANTGAEVGAEADCGASEAPQPESAATSVLIARAASAFRKV